MQIKYVKQVKVEIERLQARIEALEKVGGLTGEDYEPIWEHPKEQGAVRRASMDLTRALAVMRNCN